MKHFLTLLLSLHALGIALSFPVFLIAEYLLEPNLPSIPPALLWMPLGLCLMVFLVRGLFIALPIAVLLAVRPTWVSALAGVLFACGFSWFLFGGYSSRDRALAIAGAVAYGTATLFLQRRMVRGRTTPNATTE